VATLGYGLGYDEDRVRGSKSTIGLVARHLVLLCTLRMVYTVHSSQASRNGQLTQNSRDDLRSRHVSLLFCHIISGTFLPELNGPVLCVLSLFQRV
jgi:hypothetical protein